MDASRQATRFDAITGRFDPWLLGLIGALLCLGVVMVASSSIAIGEGLDVGPFYFLVRHLVFLTGGVALAAWMMRTELKSIEEKVAAKWATVELVVRRTSILEKTKAVDDAIRSGSSEAVAAASKSLAEALARGTELEAKDKTYARAAAGAKDASVRAEVFAHRAQVDAADRDAIAALDALTDRAQMEAAEKAIASLEKVLGSPPEAAKADRRHAAWMATFLKHKLVRGAVSGLGVLNILAGIYDIIKFRESARKLASLGEEPAEAPITEPDEKEVNKVESAASAAAAVSDHRPPSIPPQA